MNKNILIPFVALMVLAMVGAASAATVDKVEVRGTIVEANASSFMYPAEDPTNLGTSYTWNPYNFAAFWYDEDDDLKSEQLIILNLDADDNRSIPDKKLIYNTTPQAQTYALIDDGIETRLGVVSGKNVTTYHVEGWLAEKYVAISTGGDGTTTANAHKLSKLLVEFEDSSDKKTLSTGEAWDLGKGFTLTAGQIDLEGDKVWLSLDKDGKNIDDSVIDTSASGNRVYMHTEDMEGVTDVVLFSCYVDAVFRGTDSNLVQLKYVFLIDNDILKVKSDETYGSMDVKTATSAGITMENDGSIDLSKNTDAEIMEDMFFRVADSDKVRFYPYKVYTEPGDYNIRGTIIEANASSFMYPAEDPTNLGTSYTWNPYNFAAFWYDEDDDLKSEQLIILNLDADDNRSIPDKKLIYNTTPQAQTYALVDDGVETRLGVVSGKDVTTYHIQGWLAEKYVAISTGGDGTTTANGHKLSKLLVEFTDSSDKKTLSTGEAWDLGKGFTLTAGQIDLEGDKVWLSLDKDGKNIDDSVIDTSASGNRVYMHTEDMEGVTDVVLFSCYVDAVFRGTDTNLVQLKYVFLIDNDILKVKSDETYGSMDVKTATSAGITMENDGSIDLSKNTDAEIMEDMFFRVADDDTVRFYPYKVMTITGVAPPEEEETPPVEEETPVEGVTPAEVGTPVEVVETPAEVGTPVEVVETPVEEATPTATKKKVPGFEAVFAISGLLAIAYLVLRQRE